MYSNAASARLGQRLGMADMRDAHFRFFALERSA